MKNLLADVPAVRGAPECLEFEFRNDNALRGLEKTIFLGTPQNRNFTKKTATKRKLFGGSKGKQQ